jgi:hypothetical protein
MARQLVAQFELAHFFLSQPQLVERSPAHKGCAYELEGIDALSLLIGQYAEEGVAEVILMLRGLTLDCADGDDERSYGTGIGIRLTQHRFELPTELTDPSCGIGQGDPAGLHQLLQLPELVFVEVESGFENLIGRWPGQQRTGEDEGENGQSDRSAHEILLH